MTFFDIFICLTGFFLGFVFLLIGEVYYKYKIKYLARSNEKLPLSLFYLLSCLGLVLVISVFYGIPSVVLTTKKFVDCYLLGFVIGSFLRLPFLFINMKNIK